MASRTSAQTDAVVIHAPHDLRVEPVPVPALGPGDVEVRVGAGGICGSDLHYYLHGGFGAIRLGAPMVLGHELAGTVVAVGSGVTGLRVGDGVAVNPSRPCGHCRYCAMGLRNHCPDMRFYGSAARTPHVDGGFRQRLVADERQCVPLPEGLSVSEAAFAEPLAVALHAVARAGDLTGARVLVTGCGPIGLLCAMAARLKGAATIVATDVAEPALATARHVGADRAVDVSRPDALAGYHAEKGWFDVAIEASGHPGALRDAFPAVRPRGVIVQVGNGGDATLPLNTVVLKEIDLRGTFRFDAEYAEAVDVLAARQLDVGPLLTEVLPFREATRAFELAADKSRAVKVQLAFEE